MEQIKETVYLINDERYLHLRENGAGVGFATYNKVTGEPLESGQISEKNLPPDGRNAISAARNWYLFELSDDDRKAIQQESVKIRENTRRPGLEMRFKPAITGCCLPLTYFRVILMTPWLPSSTNW